ncbi:MAG TPA: polyprenyl synthetase family protein [Pseudonocardiaceae bacterium]
MADRRRQCAVIDPVVGEAAEVLSEFVLAGGKRLRPTFAWWGWRGTGSAEAAPEAVLRAVASLELVQAAALVHDDVLDGSTTRRGRPTVHVQFERRHRAAGWLGDPERFGLAGAILFGDLALAWADDLLREAGLPDAAAHRVTPIWAAMRTEVLAGQYLDVRAQAAGDESEESALRVALFKSAAYTVARPLQLGGAIGGASDAVMDAYHRLGSDLGVAFQLRDDLLGVFGDPAVTGKPAGDDLREGKRTLLVALALRAGGPGADAVRAALGRSDLDAATLDAARDALVTLGAVAEVERRITELTERALTTLAATPLTPEAVDALTGLAHAATRRAS